MSSEIKREKKPQNPKHNSVWEHLVESEYFCTCSYVALSREPRAELMLFHIRILTDKPLEQKEVLHHGLSAFHETH